MVSNLGGEPSEQIKKKILARFSSGESTSDIASSLFLSLEDVVNVLCSVQEPEEENE